MSPVEQLARLLDMDAAHLWAIFRETEQATGKRGVAERVWEELQGRVRKTRALLSVPENASREELQAALCDAVVAQEEALRKYIEGTVPGGDEFYRAAVVARRIARVGKGLFLKRECGEKVLRSRPPENVVRFLECRSVEEMVKKHDIAEIFSALRFMETDEWMHATFDAAYRGFGARDFEERDIEIRVLPPVWRPVAEKFVAKKHHNVSHLKEFGVIFLNPVREEGAGKFLRDFALILHYFHEISFYSLLFRRYLPQPDFGDKFTMLLRGDEPTKVELAGGEWLIIQQYLWKADPKDRRLFLPRVNAESVHWARGQRDLADFSVSQPQVGLAMWRGMDWVAVSFGGGSPLSFDLEDTAMLAASRSDGKGESLFYHQREALWTKFFVEFAGGEETMQELLVGNFEKGSVRFASFK